LVCDLSPQGGVAPSPTKCLVNSLSPVCRDHSSHEVVAKAVNCVRRIGPGTCRHAIENQNRGFAQIANLVEPANDSRNTDRISGSNRNDRICESQDFASGSVSLWGIVYPLVVFNAKPHIDNHHVVDISDQVQHQSDFFRPYFGPARRAWQSCQNREPDSVMFNNIRDPLNFRAG
jgi:hypothetical protein